MAIISGRKHSENSATNTDRKLTGAWSGIHNYSLCPCCKISSDNSSGLCSAVPVPQRTAPWCRLRSSGQKPPLVPLPDRLIIICLLRPTCKIVREYGLGRFRLLNETELCEREVRFIKQAIFLILSFFLFFFLFVCFLFVFFNLMKFLFRRLKWEG